jgi:hypothetical protein
VTRTKARAIAASDHGKNPKIQEPNSKLHSPSSARTPLRPLKMDGRQRKDSLAGQSVAKSDLLRHDNVQTSRDAAQQKTAQRQWSPAARPRNPGVQSRATVAPDRFTYTVSSAPTVTTISAPPGSPASENEVNSDREEIM